MQQERVAGLAYLLVIAGGMFAVWVRETHFVAGDPALTASAIAAHETLWRTGIAAHALYLLAAATVGAILYRLFRPVGPTLALLALVFTISDVAMEALLLTGLTVPLTMLAGSDTYGALDEGMRHTLGYLGVRLFFNGWNFALLLFSGFCALTGLLILRSRLIPQAIGVLMIAAGAAYFVNSLAAILWPPLSRSLQPWILLPCLVGELSFALWLASKGAARVTVIDKK